MTTDNVSTGREVAQQQGRALAEAPPSEAVFLVSYNAEALVRGVSPEIAAKWVYDVPMASEEGGGRVRGITVRAAEEGSRAMAQHGEAIRVEEVKLLREDDEEALFQATAARYIIADGAEVKLDSITRGKRVAKWEFKRGSRTERFFVKNWYEVGLSKSTRNVVLALMPSNVKSALLAAGLAAKGEVEAEGNRGAPRGNQGGGVRRQPAYRGAQASKADLLNEVLAMLKALQTEMGPAYGAFYRQLAADFPKASSNGKDLDRLSQVDEGDAPKMHERIKTQLALQRGEAPGGGPPAEDEAEQGGAENAPSSEKGE